MWQFFLIYKFEHLGDCLILLQTILFSFLFFEFWQKNGTKTNIQSPEATPLITKVLGSVFFSEEISLFFTKEKWELFYKKI